MPKRVPFWYSVLRPHDSSAISDTNDWSIELIVLIAGGCKCCGGKLNRWSNHGHCICRSYAESCFIAVRQLNLRRDCISGLQFGSNAEVAVLPAQCVLSWKPSSPRGQFLQYVRHNHHNTRRRHNGCDKAKSRHTMSYDMPMAFDWISPSVCEAA